MKDYFLYSLIRKENIDYAWLNAMPWIQKSLGSINNYHTELEHIQAQLREGFMQLWSIQDTRQGNKPICFIVSHIVQVEGFRTLIIRWCGGERIEEWLEEITTMEKWATNQNCHKVEIWGRPGWIRAMRRFGYEPEFYVVSKIIQRSVQ